MPHYYGIGHASLDNYIAMISGQAPNPSTQADCRRFADFVAAAPLARPAAGQRLRLPADVTTLADQLTRAGLTWRDYNEDMGADPTRESATCGHPAVGAADHTETATPTDMYATRHDPFVYFHSIIDNAGACDSHVVSLDAAARDLAPARSTRRTTPFITPNLCNDGHDAPCANGRPAACRGRRVPADRGCRRSRRLRRSSRTDC